MSLPECNTISLGKQYYDNDLAKTAGGALGGTVQFLITGSSATFFLILTLCGCCIYGQNGCTWTLCGLFVLCSACSLYGLYKLKTSTDHWTTACTNNPRLKEQNRETKTTN